MFALLAYAFISLFTGIVLFGHILLFRDIFSGGSSGDTVSNESGMQQQKAA
jgi:hypothetical protein